MLKFILSAIFISLSTIISAQTLVTYPGAKLYLFFGNEYADTKIRVVPETEPLILKRSKYVTFLNFAYKDNPIYYDTYIVEYKKHKYFISANDIAYNDLIDKANEDIDSLITIYNSDISIVDEAICREQQRVMSENEKQISFWKTKCLQYQKTLDSMDVVISEYADSIINKKLEYVSSFFDRFPKKLKDFDERISVSKRLLSTPNTFGGCNYTFVYINRFPKTIKYLHWIGTAYNAVNDPVTCDIKHTLTIRGEDVGPYQQYDICGGEWQNILYNHTARRFDIKQIDIEYIDGSTYSISMTGRDWALIDELHSITFDKTQERKFAERSRKNLLNYNDIEQKLSYAEDQIKYYKSNKQSAKLQDLKDEKRQISMNYNLFLITGKYTQHYKTSELLL